MRGVKFKDTKYLSNFFVDEIKVEPELVYINLHPNTGAPSEACVKVGDQVKIGSLIGKAKEGVSINVFSSVSGVVKEITEFDGKPYVIIQNDKKNTIKKLSPLKDFSKENLIKRIFDAGLFGLSGSGFPTHIKYKTDKKIDCLILNGCECENYLTCDDVLMKTKATEILIGGKLLASIFGLKTFFVGVLDNKKEAINILREAASKLEGAKAIIVKIKTRYPRGAEKLLIKHITKRVVPLGGLPADVGVIVNNVATAYAFYNAAINNLPLTDRYVCVSGIGVKKRGTTIVKNGTTILDLLEAFGNETYDTAELVEYSNTIRALRDEERATVDKNKKIELEKKIKLAVKKHNEAIKGEVSKIIIGGTMMGVTASSLLIPLGLRDGGVLFLTKNEYNESKPSNCINCKKCIAVCPVRIRPVDIAKSLEMGDFKTCKSLNPIACIACGCCSYVCPAKLNLKDQVVKAKRLK